MRGYQKSFRLDRSGYVFLNLITGGKIPNCVHKKMLEVPIACDAGGLTHLEEYVCEGDIQPTDTDDFWRARRG